MAIYVPNLAGIRATAQPSLMDAAELIAQATARRAKDHDYRDSIVVEATPNGARVTSDYSFAHLDEYGSINNPPTAAMRSSAAEAGRFEPESK